MPWLWALAPLRGVATGAEQVLAGVLPPSVGVERPNANTWTVDGNLRKIGGQGNTMPWVDCQAELQKMNVELPADVQKQLNDAASSGNVECVFT